MQIPKLKKMTHHSETKSKIVTSYAVCKPIPGLCKQWAVWIHVESAEGGVYSSPLIYLQRPKWFTDDEEWEKVCDSVYVKNITRDMLRNI